MALECPVTKSWTAAWSAANCEAPEQSGLLPLPALTRQLPELAGSDSLVAMESPQSLMLGPTKKSRRDRAGARDTPNRGRRRYSAGGRKSGGGGTKDFLVTLMGD